MKMQSVGDGGQALRWRFPVGFGKLIWATCKATEKATKERGTLIYLFERREIETQNYGRFVGWLLKHAEESRLEELRGRILFAADGWDADPRELVEIPEVRRFVHTLTEAGPAWFFLADLSSPKNLQMIAACAVEQVDVIKKRARDSFEVVTPESAVRAFSDKAMHGLAHLSDLVAIQPSEYLMRLADALEALLEEDGC